MTNKLIVGLSDKTAELFTKPGFLLIDDGPVADAFLHRYSRAKLFDPAIHSFNPLPMPYPKAREFAAVLYGDHGRDTLTARNGRRALTRLLMTGERLDALQAGKTDDEKEAQAIVDDLLLSPLMRDVFCRPTSFTFRDGNPPSSIVARLERSQIGEHDARILGAVLISQFRRQIVVPDFGFYARDFHTSLVRERRLIAGVCTLSELDDQLRQMCLLMEKVPLQCTYDDAVVLAKYAGLRPDPTREDNPYNAFIDAAMAPRPPYERPVLRRRMKQVPQRPYTKKTPERGAGQPSSGGW